MPHNTDSLPPPSGTTACPASAQKTRPPSVPSGTNCGAGGIATGSTTAVCLAPPTSSSQSTAPSSSSLAASGTVTAVALNMSCRKETPTPDRRKSPVLNPNSPRPNRNTSATAPPVAKTANSLGSRLADTEKSSHKSRKSSVAGTRTTEKTRRPRGLTFFLGRDGIRMTTAFSGVYAWERHLIPAASENVFKKIVRTNYDFRKGKVEG